ncbi:hypothetical protein C0991_007036, partial [Blastosporella zonata]
MSTRVNNKLAVFEQSHPSKLPLVSPGVLTPSVWAEIKRGDDNAHSLDYLAGGRKVDAKT